MITCPQCGAACKPSDKFCNSCGYLLANVAAPGGGFGAPPPAPGGFGAPPGPPAGFGAPPPAPGGFGAPPPPAPGGFGPVPGPQGSPYGGPPQQGPPGGYGGPPQGAPGGFGAPPPQFGAPAPGGYGQPLPELTPAYGVPPPPSPGLSNDQYGAPSPYQPPPQQSPFQPAAQPPPAQPQFGAPAPFAPTAGPPLPPPFTPDGQGPPSPTATAQSPLGGKVLRGFLVAYQANPNGDFWSLSSGRHVVGRANSGDGLDIPLADATISSRHAAVNVDPNGGIAVEDTGSTNGTYVNDEHIGMNGRRDLKDSDRVRFGGFTCVVKIIGRVG